MNLQKEISVEDHVVLLLVHNLEQGLSYDAMLNYLIGADLIKSFQKKRKVCYVTLYKSYDFLQRYFQKNKIDTADLFFIDCVTAFIREPAKKKNCTFVSAPYDLFQIGEAIGKCIKRGYDLFIFDSLSALVAYGPVISGGTGILKRFVHSFMLLNGKTQVIFICSKNDMKKFVIEESLPIFDKIVKYDCSCKSRHSCGKEKLLGMGTNGKV